MSSKGTRRVLRHPAQWRVIYLLLALAPSVVLRAAAEPFHLPKATVLIIGGLIVLAAVVWRLASGSPVSVLQTPLIWVLGAYLVAALIVTATSEVPYLSFWGEYRYFVGFWTLLATGLIVLGVLSDPHPARYRHIAFALVLGSVPVVLYGVAQLAGADPFEWSGGASGVFSTMGNSNFLAGYLVIIFPISVALGSLSGAPWIRAAALFVMLFSVPVVIASQSFQGPVGVTVGTLLPAGLILRRRLSRRWFAGVIAGALAAAAVLVTLFREPLRAEIEAGLFERVMMWDAALSIFRSDPILGKGLATFGIYFTRHRPLAHTRLGFTNPEQAHNVALNHLAEGGVLLFAAWLAAVLVVAYLLVLGLRRSNGEHQMLLAGVGGAWIAYHVQAAVSIDLPLTVLLHWVCAAVIAAFASGLEEQWTLRLRIHKGRSGMRRTLRAGTAILASVLAWFAIVPLRADIAAVSGFKTLNSGHQRGLDDLEWATDLAPRRATYWLLLAGGRQATGDMEAALDALRRAAELDAGSSRQALSVAQLAEQTGDEELALRWYREAVDRDPLHLNVLDTAAEFFSRAGNEELAADLRSRAQAIRGPDE